jgi:dephospho-CoA kinase
VTARFGPDVLAADGSLDRAALGRHVFTDARARLDLEAILHPVIYRKIADWFLSLDAPLGIVDIPLLFETGHERDVDRIVATWCPADQQMERLLARGLTRADAEARLGSQWSADRKAKAAEFVIDTGGSFADTDRQVADVLARLDHSGPQLAS